MCSAVPRADKAVLIGSHTDTVPKGGWLDGALGVGYALEIARSTIEAGDGAMTGVDVISFEDEEGTYLPFLGSRTLLRRCQRSRDRGGEIEGRHCARRGAQSDRHGAAAASLR